VSRALTLTHILLLGSYAFVVLAHAGMQEFLRRRNTPVEVDNGQRLPDIWERPPNVDVVIPAYNEQPDVLAACLESLDQQDYRGEIRFVVVDDGSSNIESLLPVYRQYAQRPNWNILHWREPGNRGKRLAQEAAIYGGRDDKALLQLDLDGIERAVEWEKSKADFIVTVDSDTVVEPDGVRWILTPFRDQRVDAATGDVGVLNHTTNRLTELIKQRYVLLCEHERAAQSHYGLVYCCAGPFSAYRLNGLDGDWPDYVGQRFMGKPCTYGDDLQLTHLVLRRGRRSIYQPKAKASTIVPTTLKGYVWQQWRWNRSAYRQFRWIGSLLGANRNPYQVFDLVARTAPSLLLAAAFAVAVFDMARLGIESFPVAFATVGGMLLTGFLSVLWQLRNPGFALLYGMIYVVLLIPTRLWALCTLRDPRWGTRALVERTFARRLARRHSPTVSIELPTTSVALGGPSEQSGSSPVTDLVAFLLEQGSRPAQFVDGFAAAATEQQHLGQVGVGLGP
jgi:N-acetylglucosaminyltransferase